MCNCKQALQEKLTARFKEQYPDGVDHQVLIGGYVFVFPTGKGIEGEMTTKPALDYRAKAKFLVKKTGLLKEKTIKGSMIASYCPFCGVPLTDKPLMERAPS